MVATVALGSPLLIPFLLYPYLTNKTTTVQHMAVINAPKTVEILQNPIHEKTKDIIINTVVINLSNTLDL